MLFPGVLLTLALRARGAWTTLINPASGKCLESTTLRDGAQVQLARCTTYGANQRWSLKNDSLINPVSGMCLDIHNPDELSPGGWKDGTAVHLRACTGRANQHWVYGTGHNGGSHVLVNPESKTCLDIRCPQCDRVPVELGVETPVHIYACDHSHQGLGKFNQDWMLTRSSNNTSDDTFIAVGCMNASDASRNKVDMSCPDGYEPIFDRDSCLEAMNRFTRADIGVNWTRPATLEKSSDLPPGCYQQLSTCGAEEFSELHLNRGSKGGSIVDCQGCSQSTLFCKRVDLDYGHSIQV